MKIFLTPLLLLPLMAAAQSQFTNTGTAQMHPGANITFFGNVINNGTITDNGLLATLGGTTTQLMGGTSATTFNNLTLQNSSGSLPQITLGNDLGVKQTFTMASGTVNLSSHSVTIGTTAASPGALDYTTGVLFDGTLKRWASITALATGDETRGLFPMGTYTGSFRPAWMGWSSDLSSGGTVSVTHNPDYPLGVIPASHIDATWAGGTLVQAVSKSNWVVTSGNGFALGGSTGTIRYGGEGYGTNTLSDLNASLLSSVAGNYAPATNTVTVLEVNRSSLSTADLSNTWRIGTRDSVTSPLPVSLLSFVVSCRDETRVIEWSTATEMQNDYFSLERSRNNVNWETLDTLDDAGTSIVYHSYSLTDAEPYAGRNYYRLMQTNFDSTFIRYSTIVSEGCGNKPDVTVFPNPSEGMINLIIHGQEKILSTDVCDANGTLIYTSNTYPSAIDLTAQAEGVYFVNVRFININIVKRVVIRR